MQTLVFTYGSMMNETEMRRRCPGARFAFIGALCDRELCFPRNSVARGGGVAGLRHRIGGLAWGVVWSIADIEISSLDRSEGYDPIRDPHQNSYNRYATTVWREGDALQSVLVDFYDAVSAPNPKQPSLEYVRLIVEGAKLHLLPSTYVASLETLLWTLSLTSTVAGDGKTPFFGCYPRGGTRPPV